MNNEVSPVNNTIIEALQNNQVIAYPTEAVFGVGCDPDSESAVMALLELKQRAIEKGLILIADNYEQLKPYIDDNALTQEQRERMFASWPGPITWVIPAKSTTPKLANRAVFFLSCKGHGSPYCESIMCGLWQTISINQRKFKRTSSMP